MDPQAVQELIGTIRTAGEAHTFEIIAWAATAILVGIACYALWFTKGQLAELQKNNEGSALQARATFLLELDRRWDSSEMQEARELLHNIREDLIKVVAVNHPRLDELRTLEKIADEFCTILSEMREKDRKNYGNIMRFCGFFETVGLMVRKGYVGIDDIRSLLMGPILDIEKYFKLHIAELQNETGVPAGLYENALYLVARVNQRDG